MFTRQPETPLFWTIFSAVFFGVLGALLVHSMVLSAAARYELELVNKQLEGMFQSIVGDSKKQTDAMLRQQRQREEQAEALRSAQTLAQRLQQEREARKSIAWSKFYQPSAACKLDSGMAKCANEHIAARKRFEDIYVDR